MSKLYLQEKLVGEPGQVVGFDADGKAVAEDNKGAPLNPETASIIGLNPESNHTADEGLFALAIGVGKYAFRLTVTAPDGTPIPGVVVSGDVANIAGGDNVVTDDNGQALVITTTPEVEVTLLSPYIDMEDKELTLTATSKINPVSAQLETRNYVEITSSRTIKFSHLCTRADVACGAAGQKGFGSGGAFVEGQGGNGGNVAIQEDVAFAADTEYSVQIGGNSNGSTSALGVIASGANNGLGGAGQRETASQNGGAGTQQIFGSFTTMKPYGGGGGGGQRSSSTAKAGGAPGGGAGGNGSGKYNGKPGIDGLGGGGGGGGSYSDNYGAGGAGGSGLCCLRMWHEEEDAV